MCYFTIIKCVLRKQNIHTLLLLSLFQILNNQNSQSEIVTRRTTHNYDMCYLLYF